MTAARRRAALVAESFRAVLRHPLASVSLLLIAGATTASVLLTSGNALLTEAEVIGSLDDEGSRVVVAYDPEGAAQIDPSAIPVLQRTAVATWVFGLGAASDVDAGVAASAPIAVRSAVGDVSAAVTPVAGRLARPGEVMLGMRAAEAAGMRDGVGTLSTPSEEWPVVGIYRAEGPLDQLNDVGLQVRAEDVHDGEPLRYVYAMAPTIGDVALLARSMKVSTIALVPDEVRVDEPVEAVEVQQIISGQLGASARRGMNLVLLVSGVLVLTVVTMVVGSRRRDVGRWRALGASRSAVVAHLLLQVAIPVAIGAGAGILIGQATNLWGRGFLNSWTFSVALVADVVLVGLVAAAVPATLASWRDPVRVLRVP